MSQTVILTPLTVCNFRKKWLIFLLLFLLLFFLLLLLTWRYAHFSLTSHKQRGSTSCVLRSRNFQLRPKFSASRESVASRVVNPKHDELRPAVGKELYQLHRKYGCTKCPTIGRFLQFYCTLYKIICPHTELLNDIDNTVISCYCLIFKPY